MLWNNELHSPVSQSHRVAAEAQVHAPSRQQASVREITARTCAPSSRYDMRSSCSMATRPPASMLVASAEERSRPVDKELEVERSPFFRLIDRNRWLHRGTSSHFSMSQISQSEHMDRQHGTSSILHSSVGLFPSGKKLLFHPSAPNEEQRIAQVGTTAEGSLQGFKPSLESGWLKDCLAAAHRAVLPAATTLPAAVLSRAFWKAMALRYRDTF
ncbi:hypothetical protein LIA77_00459 [Sarocladium implicatum]|nr:hypothetical protein LIA77_00459 [Sarocladium implicatum]